MNAALLVNFMIVSCVMLAMVVLKNDLALLGLMFLHQLPHGVPTPAQMIEMQRAEQEADESQPMGFTAKI